MAREGNVGWTQPAGNIGPQIYVSTLGGGIDFVGRVTPGVNPIPDEATLQDLGFFTTIDGVNSNRYRVYSTLPPSPPPTPGPTPPPPPYTPPVSAPQRLKVIRCNGTGGYKYLSVSPFGNYSNGMSIRFGSPYPSGYCYTIVDQDTTGSLVDGTSISVLSAYLTCTSCNSSLPTISGTTGQTCLDNGGQNGRITVTPSGGTGVYYFTLNGAGSYGIAGAAATNVDGLADGAYTITLYDDGGNSAALTGQTLACYVAPNGTVTKSCTSTDNAGGKITVTSPTGGTGTGYYFTLNGAGSYSTGATGATGLADGSYIVRLYDSIGNVSVLSTETIACYVAPTATVDVTCTSTNNAGGKITLSSVAGGTGTGYYFTVNGSGTYNPTTGATGLADGTYAIVLYDSYGSRNLGNATIACYAAPTGTISVTCVDTTGTNARIDVIDVAGGTGTGYYFTVDGSGTYTTGAGNGPTGFADSTTHSVVLYDSYGSRSLGNTTIPVCYVAPPTPAPAAPTPAPAAPTPSPEAPTPSPEAPTPTPAASCFEYEITSTDPTYGADISGIDCNGDLYNDTGFFGSVSLCFQEAPSVSGGYFVFIGECPTLTPAPAPAPTAPSPAPTPTPTPAPAAPSPTPAPAAPVLDALNYGFDSADPDIACTNWETATFVVKYNQNNDPTADGISIYDNSNGTGTPTNGYYSTGGNVWYSTSGVLSGGTMCYSGAPTPTPTPTPTPAPAAPTPSPEAPGGGTIVINNNGAFGASIDDITPAWFIIDTGSIPVSSGNLASGTHSGYVGNFGIEMSGVSGGVLVLYINSSYVTQIDTPSAGLYSFIGVNIGSSDSVQIDYNGLE